MVFKPTTIDGVCLIEPERLEDERGFFARTWCRREFNKQGLKTDLSQCSISFSRRKGTLRGLHYQAPPHEEAKLIRVTKGAIYDVVLDLRAKSPTYKKWFAAEITAENRLSLYIPEGLAHGFQTLVDNTEVFYQISAFYEPSSARGVRWNDPALKIAWPMPPTIISQRDQECPDFES